MFKGINEMKTICDLLLVNFREIHKLRLKQKLSQNLGGALLGVGNI
jgi:hypothetical protein